MDVAEVLVVVVEVAIAAVTEQPSVTGEKVEYVEVMVVVLFDK